MSVLDLSSAPWRKSSYSGGAGNDGNCVEVAFTGLAVSVRDSKHPDDGAVVMPAEQWRALLAFARR